MLEIGQSEACGIAQGVFQSYLAAIAAYPDRKISFQADLRIRDDIVGR